MSNSGELCFATWNGLFFGTYDKSFSFAENNEESYFNGSPVTSFFEYEVDKLICAACYDPEKYIKSIIAYITSNYIQIIDRSKKQVTIKVKSPATYSVVF